MAIEFRCSQCNQLLRVSDTSAGKNARCPKCKALMAVPAASTAAPAAAPPPPFPGTAPLPPFPTAGPTLGKSGPVPAPPVPPPPPAFGPIAPPASDDPFGFLKQGSGSPQPKPAGNRFGEAQPASPFGGPAAGSVNPYASPSSFASYQPTTTADGKRIGLPWETQKQTIGCWFKTMSMVLGSPTRAFATMRQRGGLGTPIMYSIWGMGMPAAVFSILAIPLFLLLGVIGAANDPAAGAGVLVVVLAIAVGIVVGVLLSATIGNMIGAGILHLFLTMAGGAKQSFETTFRVLSYAYSSIYWLSIPINFIPFGGLAVLIWLIVLLIIGLSQAHETTTGKAAFAVLVPIGLCMALYIGLIAMFVLAPLFMN